MTKPITYVVFSGKIIRATEKAVQMRYIQENGVERTEWMAKSTFSQDCQDDLSNSQNLYVEMEWEIQDWLAIQNQVEIL